jgi:hypothetical protein
MRIEETRVKFNPDESKNRNESFTPYKPETVEDVDLVLAKVKESINDGRFIYLSVDINTGNYVLREITN